MSVRSESLDSIFGVVPDTIDVEASDAETLPARTGSTELVPDTPVSTQETKEQEDDFQKSRQSLKNLMTHVDEAMTHAIDAVRETLDPKATDALAKLVNAQVAANKQLVDMHNTKKDFRDTGAPAAPAAGKVGGDFNQQNIIFNGSTKELLDLINKDRS